MTTLDWIPFASGVKILEIHPAGLFAVEKPAGVLAHPNSSEKKEKETVLIDSNYSMAEEAFHIRDGKGGVKKIYLLNRLDSPTSGVLLLCLDEKLADAVKELFAESKVSKKYAAIVKGRGLRSPRGTWQDSLVKSSGPGGSVRSSAKSNGGSQAITVYQWVRAAQNNLPLSLLQLEPRTGRTHQLRVQTAEHGHPILGDRTYGDFDFNKTTGTARGLKRLFLHAQSTELSLDWQGEKFHFKAESPLPKEFLAALGESGDGPPAKIKKPAPTGTTVSPRLRIRL
ncbi:MAG: RluA family pseudouridine synthase [Opitutae bacterium]